MNRRVASIVIAGIATCLHPAYSNAAGQVVEAKVVQVRVDSDGKGMVIFDRSIAGTPPTCVIPTYSNALAFSNTSGGKTVMALALAAKASGGSITAYGLGVCRSYGNYVEDWDYGAVK